VRNLFEASYPRALDRIEKDRKTDRSARRKQQSFAPEVSGAPLMPTRSKSNNSRQDTPKAAPEAAQVEDDAKLSVGCAVLLDMKLVPGYEQKAAVKSDKSAGGGGGTIEEGDRVRALPGIECQGVDPSVVGKEGTVRVKSDDLQVEFDGESRKWYTSESYVEKVKQVPITPTPVACQTSSSLEGRVLDDSDAAAVHVQLGGAKGPVYLLEAKELQIKVSETSHEIELNAAADGTYGISTSGLRADGPDEFCVTSLNPGSPAATDGRLKLGDRIRVVNGNVMLGWQDVQEALKPSVTGKPKSDWPNSLYQVCYFL